MAGATATRGAKQASPAMGSMSDYGQGVSAVGRASRKRTPKARTLRSLRVEVASNGYTVDRSYSDDYMPTSLESEPKQMVATSRAAMLKLVGEAFPA